METIPYDKRSGKIWFNSKLVDWQKASGDPLISPEASKKLFDIIISAGTKERKKINYKSLMSIKP